MYIIMMLQFSDENLLDEVFAGDVPEEYIEDAEKKTDFFISI